MTSHRQAARSAPSPSLSDDERAVLALIERVDILESLSALVAAPSCDGHESAAQSVMAGLMREAGLTIDQWAIDLDELQRHPAFSAEIERREAIGLVGFAGRHAGRGRDLILNGHIDVVSAGDQARWRHRPWKVEIENGLAFGRGVVDMKGGLVCAVTAARALHKAGIEPLGRLIIESVVGEEDGGLGTLATILRGYRADGAVVVEPTRLAVVPVQAGALTFRMRVQGLAAHAAMRWEGVSALEKFALLYDAVLALEKARTDEVRSAWFATLFRDYPIPCPIGIGRLRAGEWPSTVPEELVCEGRLGVMPGEDLARAKERFEHAVAQAAADDEWLRSHPPVVEWWGGRFAPGTTDTVDPLVQALAAVHADLVGEPPAVAGVTYGADMGLLVNEAGIPTVLYGPGDVACAHQPDEQVPLAELERATAVLALLSMRFCGYRSQTHSGPA